MGELQGRVFGGYQLQEQLGGAGVAEVYRARQATAGGREVVVKVIFPEFARQPGFAQNFAHITQTAARLANHPHVLPLIASGEEGDYLYLVTPYVKDGSLADWIAKGGRMGASDVGPFFQQISAALGYAHSLGVVHGNVKPSNIYLYEGRHALLGDFGLLWTAETLDPSWSGSGVEAFEYLAPEVFAGQVTQAGDIYSLGVTLYQSLTGHPPFHRERLADLITAAQSEQPPSLAAESPALAPAVVALDGVARQAMAKRPQERPPSALALAQGIEATVRAAMQNGWMAQSMPGQPGQLGQGPGQPLGQPQWQPLPSTPVSAGVFGASSAAGAADGLVAGLAIGALAAGGIPGVGSGALAGGAPLGRLDPPFPPLPPSNTLDGQMEQGGQALALGSVAAPGAGGALEGPTMRVAAPYQPSVGGPEGADPLQPITSPRVGRAPSSGLRAPAERDAFAASGSLPPDATGASRALTSSQRLPAVSSESLNGAQSGQFSATELGLPRLTNPAMGDLPSNWQELLTDESALRRHDPFTRDAASPVDERAELPPIDAVAPPSVLLPAAPPAPQRRATPGPRPQQRGERSGALRRGADDEMSAADEGAWQGSQPGAGRRGDGPVLRETARPWEMDAPDDGLDLAAQGRKPTFGDTLLAQRVWTKSVSVVRPRRLRAGTVALAFLALLTIVELLGFAVLRPDLCVTKACAVVAAEIHKVAPNLQAPGAPAPIMLSPGAPAVQATANGSGATTLTVANTSAGALTWRAVTTLGWLDLSPASGSLGAAGKATLTLTARPNGIAPGAYSGAVVITAGTGKSVVLVAVTVTPGPQLSAPQQPLAFSSCGVSLPLTISNSGGATLTYSASPSQASALTVSPGNGSIKPGDKATLTVTLSCGASTGRYAVILVSNGGSAQTPVTYGS